jgi:hypothetical protein
MSKFFEMQAKTRRRAARSPECYSGSVTAATTSGKAWPE